MRQEETSPGSLQTSTVSFAIWLTIALALGCLCALMGVSGLYVVLACCTLAVFTMVVARWPTGIICAAILCLGLSPYNFDVLNSPKLFGDEVLLIPYIAIFPVLLLFTRRLWHGSPVSLYVMLGFFLALQAVAITNLKGDLIAFRNLLETLILGPLLLILFLQETANGIDEERVALAVVWVTVIIAVLSILERITGRNPIMEHSTDIFWLSPEIARATEGVYRPYVTFFSSSESGTFMALGAPFVIRNWVRHRSVLSSCLYAAFLAGLLVNATRGVWVSLALVVIFFSDRLWKILLAITPVILLAGAGLYTALSNNAFVQKLTDPNNLYSRFVFWQLTGKIFLAHPIFGVGHLQFKNIYLDYVRDLSNLAHFDIGKVSVADNMYLTTAVEHGLFGLFGLLIFLAFLARLLNKMHRKLMAASRTREASLVRASAMSFWVYCGAGLFADVNQFTKATKYLCILVGFALGAGTRYFQKASQNSAEFSAPAISI